MFDETHEVAWQKRFGVPPPTELPDLGRLLNHRSVRRYSNRQIPEETKQAILAAGQSAATSSSLQLWSAISVEDPIRRDRITELCDNQRHVREAPWFLAFFADHFRLKRAAARYGEACEGLPYTEFFIMAVIDAALAAERMVCAAESLGIGVCYIGALRNHADGVKELFELPEGVFGVFGLCLGYPAEPLMAEIKPRLSQKAVCFRDRYDREVDVSEYDERMKPFYESQNMKGNFTWSARSGRRVDLHHMTGRHILKGWLEKHDMNRL